MRGGRLRELSLGSEIEQMVDEAFEKLLKELREMAEKGLEEIRRRVEEAVKHAETSAQPLNKG